MTMERREARLRPEFADLYQGVPANQWRPIGELLDRVKAARLLGGRRSGELLSTRALDDRHFEFRGGATRPAERSAPRSRATDLR
jgi:hypothetical protein